MRRVVVTGLGAVTPLSIGVKRTWQRLINGESGIVSTTSLGPAFASLPSQVAGIVPDWKAEEWCAPTEIKQAAKFAQFGLAASAEALKDAGFDDGRDLDKDTTGVCLGSGIGNLEELYESSLAYSHEANYRKIHPLFVPRILINLGAGHISMRYGLRGPSHTATTACTTGAHSIGDAMRFIQHGDADVMIAGGAESCIHPLAIGGFSRSRSLATSFNDRPTEASRPFDKERNGFVIAEGAAVMILEDLEHAKRRDARIYAELIGYACSSDAHHLTAPPESGSGALQSMRKALKAAQVSPHKVDYINAHATSTPLGDAAENRAIKTLVLENNGDPRAGAADSKGIDDTLIKHPEQINVSSTKGAIGHLLGAAGAIEALFSVLAIHTNTMPPTLNLQTQTPEFNCNYAANQAQERRIDVALSNSFGFGGTNASLCFRRL